MASNQRFRPYVGPKGSQPPHPRDPPEGAAPLERWGDEREEGGYQGPALGKDELHGGSPPGLTQDDVAERAAAGAPAKSEWAEVSQGEQPRGDPSEPDWEKLTKDAYRTAINFFDENYRQKLDDSLRAFNNQHPADSKYNSETFRKRSHRYRPKTRTIIRKNEAALCAALFSNMDLIETEAANPADKEEVVSAEVMKALLQERLTVTMPWFKFAIGAMQDAQTQGAVCAHSYWKYEAYTTPRGEYKVRNDKPVQDLVPLENFLFDPNADWTDVVGSSPYLIHKIPMYIGEVMERMRNPDPKGNTWIEYSEQDIAGVRKTGEEGATRAIRAGTAEDPAAAEREINAYQIVWVHRHIHRIEGVDWDWYTLDSRLLLSDPEPLETNVWFGDRPYVLGVCLIETHRPIPASLPTLTRALQDEANDIDNQLSDNMKFILNKRWLVRRGANVDTPSLIRNVPGGSTMVNDVDKDVKEVTWPDIPQSAYEQTNRNNADFDDLAGNFNPMALSQTRTPRESFRTVNAVQSPAMMMTEYTLMTLVQTFLLPVMRQLVLLEQYYETDQVMLAIAGTKSQIMKKFGVDQVTDAILEKRMSVNINLGMGATDPSMKLQRFSGALTTMANLSKQPPGGVDLGECFKELLALSGYRDSIRFMQNGQDPEKMRMMLMIRQLTEKLKALELDKRNKHEANVVKLVTGREANIVKLLTAQKEDDHQNRHLLVGHLLELEKMDRQAEMARTLQAEGAMQSQAQQAQGAAQAAGAAETAGKNQMALAKLKGRSGRPA